MDNFREESISKADRGLSKIVYILAYIGMIVFGLATLGNFMAITRGSFNIPTIFLTLIFAGISYGCFVLKNNQRVEYDYTFTNGILDIAKITNYSKRKKLLSTDIREFEIIAPIGHKGFEKTLNHGGIEKKHNYFLNRGAGLYYGVFYHEGKKSLLVFEPTEDLIEMFKIYNPRNVEL